MLSQESVRLPVTRRYCVETAEHIIKLFHNRVATSATHSPGSATLFCTTDAIS